MSPEFAARSPRLDNRFAVVYANSYRCCGDFVAGLPCSVELRVEREAAAEADAQPDQPAPRRIFSNGIFSWLCAIALKF